MHIGNPENNEKIKVYEDFKEKEKNFTLPDTGYQMVLVENNDSTDDPAAHYAIISSFNDNGDFDGTGYVI